MKLSERGNKGNQKGNYLAPNPNFQEPGITRLQNIANSNGKRQGFSSSRGIGHIKEVTAVKLRLKETHKLTSVHKDTESVIYSVIGGLTLKCTGKDGLVEHCWHLSQFHLFIAKLIFSKYSTFGLWHQNGPGDTWASTYSLPFYSVFLILILCAWTSVDVLCSCLGHKGQEKSTSSSGPGITDGWALPCGF